MEIAVVRKYPLEEIFSIVESTNRFEKLAETGRKNALWISYRAESDFVTMDLFFDDNYLDDWGEFKIRLDDEYDPDFVKALINASFEKVPTSRILYAKYEDIEFFVELYRR